jgi:hypothetical protein
MAKGGGKKRTYVRDGNGRFASTPGGGKSAALKGGTLSKRSSLKGSRAKLAAKDKADPSIRNTLSTRAQKGAVTRGNKALRAAKAASQRTAVGRSRAGTVAKGKKSPVLKTTVLKPQAARVPASQRPGSMTSTLRATMGALTKADARRIREVELITGQKVKPTAAGAKAGKEAGARVRATAKSGKVSDTLRAGLRELAQSDARTMRGMAGIARDATPKVAGGKGGKALKGAKKGSSSQEPVTVQKAIAGKGYKIPPRPAATTAVRSSSDQPSKPKTQAKTQADSGKRVEKRIASIMDRRINRSASPEKQFKALQTQKRAAEYLRAASKFAERKNVSLSKALQSGPKNSTKPKPPTRAKGKPRKPKA